MILSSADILRILGGSEIIRLSAKLKVVDGRPSLSGAEGLFIYIERFPRVDEFQATWSIYIESDGSEPDDLVTRELERLLPSVKITEGLFTTATTTDFLSENTQRAPEATGSSKAQVDLSGYEERFQALAEDVQDRMLLVSSGRAGKDGANGRDGVNGRDGKDLVATEAELFDLQDVEQGIQMERGQVLTWDGSKWTNLFVPQLLSGGGSGGSAAGKGNAFVPWEVEGQETLTAEGEEPIEFVAGDGISLVTDTTTEPQRLTIIATGGDIPEAPLDGNYYVRKNGQWINMLTALQDLGVAFISGPDEIEYIEPE